MQMNVKHKPRHTAMEHAQSTNNKQQAMVHAQNTINTHKPETMSHDTCTSETTHNTDDKAMVHAQNICKQTGTWMTMQTFRHTGFKDEHHMGSERQTNEHTRTQCEARGKHTMSN